jgi:predicted kinase
LVKDDEVATSNETRLQATTRPGPLVRMRLRRDFDDPTALLLGHDGAPEGLATSGAAPPKAPARLTYVSLVRTVSRSEQIAATALKGARRSAGRAGRRAPRRRRRQNAGILQAAAFEDRSRADWRRTLAPTSTAAFHLSQPAYPAVWEQGSGRFVFVASSAGAFGRGRRQWKLVGMLIVMTGLPCTGKSTIASAAAEALHAPIYSVDPLEAVLIRGGVDRSLRSDVLAYDLAAWLAEEQMRRGESAVVDAVNALGHLRAWFLRLARDHGQPAGLIETTCADKALHRRLVEGRNRHIDGFDFEPSWADIEERALEFETPDTDRLVLDAGTPVDENIVALKAWLATTATR